MWTIKPSWIVHSNTMRSLELTHIKIAIRSLLETNLDFFSLPFLLDHFRIFQKFGIGKNRPRFFFLLYFKFFVVQCISVRCWLKQHNLNTETWWWWNLEILQWNGILAFSLQIITQEMATTGNYFGGLRWKCRLA